MSQSWPREMLVSGGKFPNRKPAVSECCPQEMIVDTRAYPKESLQWATADLKETLVATWKYTKGKPAVSQSWPQRMTVSIRKCCKGKACSEAKQDTGGACSYWEVSQGEAYSEPELSTGDAGSYKKVSQGESCSEWLLSPGESRSYHQVPQGETYSEPELTPGDVGIYWEDSQMETEPSHGNAGLVATKKCSIGNSSLQWAWAGLRRCRYLLGSTQRQNLHSCPSPSAPQLGAQALSQQPASPQKCPSHLWLVLQAPHSLLCCPCLAAQPENQCPLPVPGWAPQMVAGVQPAQCPEGATQAASA